MSKALGGLRLVLAIAFTALVMAALVSFAARNSSGTMSSANGPYVSGTVINSSAVNDRLSDIENEITDSLSRSGKGGMTAPLRTADGSVAAPAFSWTSETNSGLFRNGTDDVRMSIGGSAKEFWSASNGVGVGGAPPSAAGASGSLSIMNGANQSFLFMQDARGAVGNKLGRLIYDGSSLAGGTGNLAKPGWAFQSVDDTGAFVGSGVIVFRDGTLSVTGATIGSTGTAITQMNTGVGTFNGASTATFTATVASGAKCVATRDAVGGAAGVSAAVSGTTLTVTSTVSLDTHTATWICF